MPPRKPMNIEDFKKKIIAKELFGLVICDVHTPDHLKEHFAQFPPIFKNAEISREDVGEYTRRRCEEMDVLKKPRRTLIASYFGVEQLFTTDQLAWYLEHGK